jgi:hypothetical protein
VPDGPVAYRQRLRWLGPLLALLLPFVALLVAAGVAEGVDCTGRGCAAKGATVFSLLLGALPTAMLLGIPFEGGTSRYLLAVSTSTALWLVVGAVAGRRATQAAVASWRDWWREYLLLAGGIWLGVVAALALVATVLGLGVL